MRVRAIIIVVEKQ